MPCNIQSPTLTSSKAKTNINSVYNNTWRIECSSSCSTIVHSYPGTSTSTALSQPRLRTACHALSTVCDFRPLQKWKYAKLHGKPDNAELGPYTSEASKPYPVSQCQALMLARPANYMQCQGLMPAKLANSTQCQVLMSAWLAQLVNAPTQVHVQSCSLEFHLHSQADSLTQASILTRSVKRVPASAGG